jgi:hypothetical protein
VTDVPSRIAMWSGPRNLSTAMMRSFENRSDVAEVWDEPFYAAYLAATGKCHPMRDEVLAAQCQDWRVVAGDCLGAPAGPGNILYFKQMSHHLLPEFSRGWLDQICNIFLVRSPERVVASYAAKNETVMLEDIGFTQQAELFDRIADRTGNAPPVIDAERVRSDPEGMLRRLCAAVGLDFEPAMLSWPAGPRASDGVWSAHWYGSVLGLTGFAPPDADPAPLSGPMAALAEAARPAYERLLPHAL